MEDDDEREDKEESEDDMADLLGEASDYEN